MASQNFPACLAFTLKYEGGRSNNPRDPGGRTNQGVIQRTYDAYRDSKGVRQQDVYAMTNAERDEIYRTGYWNAVTADSLPAGIDLCIWDYGVNSGPARALRAYATAGRGKKPADAIHAICSARLSFLHALRTWSYFGAGWGKRVAACEATALKMAGAPLESSRDKLKGKKSGADTGAIVVAGGGIAALWQNWHLHWMWIAAGALILAAVILWFIGKSRQAGDRADALSAAITEMKAKRDMLAQTTKAAVTQATIDKAEWIKKQQELAAAETAIADLGVKQTAQAQEDVDKMAIAAKQRAITDAKTAIAVLGVKPRDEH